MTFSISFVSVFETSFDVAVYGAGVVGYAAAQRLAANGWKVLLFDSSADLLWEATRALENRTGERSGAWGGWVDYLVEKGAGNGRFFEAAQAEVIAADHLRASTSLRMLLYAVPVGVREEGGNLVGVCVATKGGFRTIRAGRWVDASEEGVLAKLCRGGIVSREPEVRFHSLAVQTLQPELLENAVSVVTADFPGLECLASFRPEERRLRWPVGTELPHRKSASLLKALRDRASGFFVTHSSLRSYPVYGAGGGGVELELPGNLCVVSPSLVTGSIGSLADRYHLGWSGVEEIVALPGAICLESALASPVPNHEILTEVVVAGTGTAGAVSAISAARNGAEVIAIDFASSPGGIGVGGLITGYFHGVPGGLQSELDLRTQAMTLLMTGKERKVAWWHHDAKRTVLLEMFEEAGVRFMGDALLCGVEKDSNGRVTNALVATPGRLIRLSAAAFVDATGDGDLCAQAGANSIHGRTGDGRSLSYSQSALLLLSTEDGFAMRGNNFDAGWVDPTDSEDLTRARLEGLAQYAPLDWKKVGPFVAMAPLLGLRQSRQMVTDYSITLSDMIDHARFEDSLGSVATVADSHSVDYEFESDDLAFYFWTCRAFRHRLHCELPYRMLLPVGLANVWIACRAAGISYDAANGLRMQREMQRIGEAAGVAAALAARSGCDSRSIDLSLLFNALDSTGARQPHGNETAIPTSEALFESLDKGLPGIHLWHLYQQWESHCGTVLARLDAENPNVSFFAAAVAAMAGDAAGETRLLQAICNREVGITPEEVRVPGAYGQLIDIPFWLQAVVLLRRVGTEKALIPLQGLIAEPGQPFNVLTTIALTLESLAARLNAHPELLNATELLLSIEPADAYLPPSRSLWRTIFGEEPVRLANDRGTDTRQDHTWQLHLVLLRIQRALGLPQHPKLARLATDPRGFVRRGLV